MKTMKTFLSVGLVPAILVAVGAVDEEVQWSLREVRRITVSIGCAPQILLDRKRI